MIQALLIPALIFLMKPQALAQHRAAPHGTKTCSYLDANLCGQITFEDPPQTQKETLLFLSITGAPNLTASALKLDLWLNEHEQNILAPTPSIQELGDNHFAISKVFFPQSGTWLVRLRIQKGTANHKLQFPLLVE
jgi:hypothetical protein